MGAWESQAERVAYLATDRLNLIWVMPAQGRTLIVNAASLAIFEQVIDIAGTYLDNTSGGKRRSEPDKAIQVATLHSKVAAFLNAQKGSRAWIRQNCLCKMSRKRLVRDAKV
jgi:hypothetical protein